jgi:prefoldin beta subunit
MSLPARLQAASADYQKLQADLSGVVEARQRLDAQLSENELVKKVNTEISHPWCCKLTCHTLHQEFTTLTPNNVVFKLVGPGLVKQDQAEARANVDKRLEFIRGEMSVPS